MTEEQKENRAVKMQKLRLAVERVRNVRSSEDAPATEKQSWLSRLKARLGLGEGHSENDSE